jgi:hypothetical protein
MTLADNHELWRKAKTLEDVGEMTANWIEGTSNYHPDYWANTVDEETIPLRSVLANFNRRGLVTDFSQPGKALTDEGFAQRAAVSGYACESVANRLAALTHRTYLVVFIFEPGMTGCGNQIPSTLNGF